MKRLVADIFADWQEGGLLKEHRGGNPLVEGIAPADSCGSTDLVFVDKPAFLEAVRRNKPACVVTTANLAEGLAEVAGLALLISPNVGLAQALLRQKYVDRNLRPGQWPDIHPSAVIHDTASLGEGVIVGPQAVIESGVMVGQGCVIMAGAVIEHGASLGDRTVIHPHVTIGYDCRLGNEVIVHSNSVIGCEGYGFAQDEKGKSYRIPQLGIVVIEDRVRVGAGNCIDRAAYAETRIGAGTKLDNHCHIAHNVKIGQDCLLTAGLIVAGSTTLGNRVIASGDTGFIDHLTICDDAVFVHKAGVIKDVNEPGVYAGMPAQPMADYTRNMAAGRKVSEMRKQLRDLEKKVGELEKG
jgi:UDP-3-O-[3-hydroxymyristoyl] glucosamine N-acyltransferase